MPVVAAGRRPTDSGLSVRLWAAVLVGAALLQITLVTIYYQPEPKLLIGDEVLYLDSVRSLRLGEADPDPLRAPLYARLLQILGVSPTNRAPIQILQIGMLLGAAWALRQVTRRLLGSPLAGDLAAVLLLLYPTLGAFAHYLWPEILHLGLWVGAFAILASGRLRGGWQIVAGALLALAVLSRHLLLPFLPLVAAALWIDERRRGGQPLRAVGRLVVPMLLLAGPFLVADRLDDGRLRAASNVRFNLWVGLNDPSPWSGDEPIVYDEYLDYLASGQTPFERDRRLTERIGRHLDEHGWAAVALNQLGKQYFRLFDAESFFTAQLPGGRLHGDRRGYRGVPSVLGTVLGGLDHTVYALLLVGAAWGLWRVPYDRSIWLGLALVFLVYNLVLFAGLHAKSRYLLQTVPFLALFAAAGIAGWLRGPRLAPGRRSAAIAVAALLLFLAFGPSWLG